MSLNIQVREKTKPMTCVKCHEPDPTVDCDYCGTAWCDECEPGRCHCGTIRHASRAIKEASSIDELYAIDATLGLNALPDEYRGWGSLTFTRFKAFTIIEDGDCVWGAKTQELEDAMEQIEMQAFRRVLLLAQKTEGHKIDEFWENHDGYSDLCCAVTAIVDLQNDQILEEGLPVLEEIASGQEISTHQWMQLAENDNPKIRLGVIKLALFHIEDKDELADFVRSMSAEEIRSLVLEIRRSYGDAI